MSTYLIGDIHGCYRSLTNILNEISFNPKKDILWLTGDLVAKGPNSLTVLNLIYNIRNNVRIVLGNHDLNLLRVYSQIHYNKINKKKDTDITYSILNSPHINKLITWLKKQPIIQIDEEKKILMTHAGINPTWDIDATKKYAKEIEQILHSNNYPILLHNINSIKKFHTNISNIKFQDIIRIQCNINIFTKMRYLLPNGELDMEYKDIPEKVPSFLKPWFKKPNLILPHYNIIFGHWSALQGKGIPHGIYGLDSGCYRGGKLTLLHWENKKIIHIPCNPNFL